MNPRSRWAVPAVVAVVVAGGAAVAPSVASAAPDLAPTTPAQLLADVAAAPPQALSGTVQLTTDLGLPELPSAGAGGASGAQGGSQDLTGLLGGTTTARVWTDGAERSRVSVVDGLSETTVVRSGSDLWTWRSGGSSQRGTTHAVLPAAPAGDAAAGSPALPQDLTPQEAAERVLAAVDADTAVSLGGTATVAGRAARLLVVQPRTADTLVGRVVLAVDAETSTPLRVQVFARGASDPAVSVGFTDVRLGEPAAADLTPAVPSDAPVEEVPVPAQGAAQGAKPAPGGATSGVGAPGGAQVVGSGWTAVAVLAGGSSATDVPELPAALASATTEVTGSFGSGRVLSTPLLTVLLTDDGRVLAGAVPEAALEAAAAQR